VHLAFDIFQGIGIALALGIRPFLPALAAGALAAGNVEIHFTHTSYDFLQKWPFLLVMALAAIAVAMLERSVMRDRADSRPVIAGLGLVGAVLGALMFAGSLARGHYAAWPGWIGGVICAVLALAATRPLLARVRARLDRQTASALPIYAEVLAVLVAALSVLAPPLGVIALVLFAALLVRGRARGEQKYAGLRILR
jgi:CDP-diglyceride synthetase